MIEIKHLEKHSVHIVNSDRWLLLLRCCTRPNPLRLISSAIWNNAWPPACSCVKLQPLRLITPQGKFCCNWQNVLPQSAVRCRRKRTAAVRLRTIECHSCIREATPAGKLPCKLAAGRNGFHIRRHFDPATTLQQGELDLVMTSIFYAQRPHYSADV